MFLVDKYKVNSLDDVILHSNIYKKLVIGYDINNRMYDLNELDQIIESKQYNQIEKFHNSKQKVYRNYEQMPNLLIHGPPGCGKHTMIKLLLSDIFNNSINDTFTETYPIKGYGNTVLDVDVQQSKYHLIIEPNNTGLDKYLIQEIVKEYAKKKIINTGYNHFPYRVVLINNVDNLNYLAQTSLRCTMEKYHKTCRFILCGQQVSKIIDPIRSRCLDIRIPSPTSSEMEDLVYHIMLSEKQFLNKSLIDNIIKQGNGNIKKTLWNLQMELYGIHEWELSWKKSLDGLIKMMVEFKLPKPPSLGEKLIIQTRNILYNIFTTNIPGIEILHEIINKTISSKEFNTDLLYQIMEIASETEVRLTKGKRSIIHLDSFMCKIYQIIYLHYNPIKQSLVQTKI